jgi:integrase
MNATLEKTKTPGIYKRGGRYVAVYRDGRGKQRKAFAPTLKAARAVKAAKMTDVNRGEHRELSQETFASYAPKWITTYAGRTKRGLGSDTRDDYRKALERHAIPFLGRLRLSEIEPRDIKALAKEIGDSGVSAGTVRLQLAPVKALLAEAFEEGLIRANPAAGVRIARPDHEHRDHDDEVQPLAPEQLAQLLEELPAEWRLFYVFLAETGLRIGEAIEVRFGDVDFGTRRLSVDRQFYRGKVRKPKGGKTRRIPISRELSQALWTRQGHEDELLFTSERGQRIDQSNLMRRVLKPAAVRAGLGTLVKGRNGLRAKTWVGHHTFRHTAATTLFRDGWNAKQVQRFLGHSDAGFTLRVYVHLLDEDLPEPPSVGNKWATGEAQADRNETTPLAAVSAS